MDRKGGGSASISHTSLTPKQISFDGFTTSEYHAFVFNSPPVLCTTIYRPHKQFAAFVDEFSGFKKFVVAGIQTRDHVSQGQAIWPVGLLRWGSVPNEK